MAIQMNPVLNQCFTFSRYLSHLWCGSFMERLDKLNGLGPLLLRWFPTQQEKNHGPHRPTHITTRGFQQPWPGVTDSPKWFLSRRHIYIYTVHSMSALPAGDNVWRTVLIFLNEYEFLPLYFYSFYIFSHQITHNICVDVLILLRDFILIITIFLLKLE